MTLQTIMLGQLKNQTFKELKMENYLNFKRKDNSIKALNTKLRAVYKLHKEKNKEQFKNEFGKINKFNEVILIFNFGGGIIESIDRVQIKTGTLDKEFLDDIKKVLEDFGFSL